jgi:hypothetical protein
LAANASTQGKDASIMKAHVARYYYCSSNSSGKAAEDPAAKQGERKPSGEKTPADAPSAPANPGGSRTYAKGEVFTDPGTLVIIGL